MGKCSRSTKLAHACSRRDLRNLLLRRPACQPEGPDAQAKKPRLSAPMSVRSKAYQVRGLPDPRRAQPGPSMRSSRCNYFAVGSNSPLHWRERPAVPLAPPGEGDFPSPRAVERPPSVSFLRKQEPRIRLSPPRERPTRAATARERHAGRLRGRCVLPTQAGTQTPLRGRTGGKPVPWPKAKPAAGASFVSLPRK
jgi:hypothetical protein